MAERKPKVVNSTPIFLESDVIADSLEPRKSIQKCISHFAGRVDAMLLHDQGDAGIPSNDFDNFGCESR